MLYTIFTLLVYNITRHLTLNITYCVGVSQDSRLYRHVVEIYSMLCSLLLRVI